MHNSAKKTHTKTNILKEVSNMNYKPGDQATKGTKLYVKDENGNVLGEIQVPSGNRVPPTRIESADHYSTKK